VEATSDEMIMVALILLVFNVGRQFPCDVMG